MRRRQTDVPASQRLFQPERQSILVAAGDEGEARCRTDRGVRVGLQESHAVRSKTIDIRCMEIGTSVARYVGIAEIISHDEKDVGRIGHGLTKSAFPT